MHGFVRPRLELYNHQLAHGTLSISPARFRVILLAYPPLCLNSRNKQSSKFQSPKLQVSSRVWNEFAANLMRFFFVGWVIVFLIAVIASAVSLQFSELAREERPESADGILVGIPAQ